MCRTQQQYWPMPEDLPFDDNKFDVITCCYGYMFCEDKLKALQESYRVLKTGGMLVAPHGIIWTS